MSQSTCCYCEGIINTEDEGVRSLILEVNDETVEISCCRSTHCGQQNILLDGDGEWWSFDDVWNKKEVHA